MDISLPTPKELSEAIEVLAKFRIRNIGRKSVQIALGILQALQNGELVSRQTHEAILKAIDDLRSEDYLKIKDLEKQLSEKSEEAEKYKDEIEKQASIIEELEFKLSENYMT